MRIRGIDLRVHATFALILVWAAYYWGFHRDTGLQGAAFGLVATLLLFTCVTLHELGHSLMAQHYGIEIEDITLLPIGGVARLEIPDNPKQELWIAVAGPAVNVVIVAVLIAAGAVLEATSIVTPSNQLESMRQAEWGGLLPYLTLANVWLILFNILPAFPMDGGRILRALLATRLGYRRGTEIAVTIGQGMALLFGLVGFITGDFFLLLIAAFVWIGAAAEGEQGVARTVLRRVKVGNAMTRRPHVLSSSDSVTRAVHLTMSTSQADFPVVDGYGRLVGLLTANDLLAAVRDRPTATVESLMRRDVPKLSGDESLADAQQRLIESNLPALPVVDDQGRLAGLLTLADVGEAYRLLAVRPDLMVQHPSMTRSDPEVEAPAMPDRRDLVVEASLESLPASDPPAWAGSPRLGRDDGHPTGI
jgi:stage IV sporulation protein FB